MSQVIWTSLFSATANDWWSYHLSVYSILSRTFFAPSSVLAGSPCHGVFLYCLWASFLHPLIICLTVSIEFTHNLHSGVSEVLAMLCSIEFFLKLVLEQLRSNLLFPPSKPVPKPSPGIFSSYICRLTQKSPCRAFFLPVPGFLLLLEILFFI